MFIRFLAVGSLIVLAAATGSLGADASRTVPSDGRAVAHALNRLTFGPRPGDVARVQAVGLQSWIEQQLSPSRISDTSLEARLARLTTLGLDSKTLAREFHVPAQMERRRRQAAGPPMNTDEPQIQGPQGSSPKPQVTETSRKDRQIVTDLAEAKLLRAVYSERQLEEVLVDFWFNHFNVFAGKGPERVWIGEYERVAIRPYVLGNFRQMLGAVAKSEAMLFYLDNWQSAAADGPAPGLRPKGGGPFSRRPSGINENYARELMELHTLGVDGGYTQQDVTAVARAFTGWTIGAPGRSGFRFDESRHDRGEKTVLGHVIKAGGGMSDGEQVLDILAADAATARFIATKLAVRLVSDDPPAALVDRAAARFTATKGDLREVLRTIVTSPEFSASDIYGTKVKTPLEFVASALRATGADIRNAQPLVRELRDMGMPLYFCNPPTGYDETAVAWVSSGALVARMNFAVALGDHTLRGVQLPATAGKALATTIGSPDFQRR